MVRKRTSWIRVATMGDLKRVANDLARKLDTNINYIEKAQDKQDMHEVLREIRKRKLKENQKQWRLLFGSKFNSVNQK